MTLNITMLCHFAECYQARVTFYSFLCSVSLYWMSLCWASLCRASRHLKINQGILKGTVSLYRWPPVWLVWNQLHDNWHFLFLFAKQTYLSQSNRRSTVQWYSSFSIPWMIFRCHDTQHNEIQHKDIQHNNIEHNNNGVSPKIHK